MTDLELAQEDSSSTPILFLLLLPQTTCTRKHMHAHMHICTDVEPPSAPAAPCLAPPCLPPFLPPSPPPLDLLFCLCSHSDPQLQPQPSPLLPGTVVSRLPLGFQRVPLCSLPGEHAAFGGVVGLVAHRPGSDWDLGPRQTRPPPHRTLSSGGGSYQVATPLPLSSRAFPVGRTRSRTGSVSDGQPYFLSFCFWVCLFFSSCVRAQ